MNIFTALWSQNSNGIHNLSIVKHENFRKIVWCFFFREGFEAKMKNIFSLAEEFHTLPIKLPKRFWL